MRRQLDLRAAAAILADRDVTMTEVAARLGVAKPTLYKLASSRDELVRRCVETEAERLLGHLHEHEATPAGVLRAVEGYARDSPGGFRLLCERRAAEAEGALRRLESRLGELARSDDLRGAALLGGAVAVVSRALADGLAIDAAAY
ncbi:MAG TPA: TetR family transcriptional regulator [Casimicrobiaceae bacterium]